jgi:SAM-dependent methyltransferase
MSFGAVANDYNRLRPSPPDTAVQWLLPANAQVVADLGAGTGLLSRALARQVPRVIAVEPDERMRAVLAANSPGIEVAAGQGEEIPLPDASVDGVFISSAWHWMDPERTVPEITRVLRDGGRLGLIWTSRDYQVGWLRDLAQRDPRERDGLERADDDGDSKRARRGSRVIELPAGAALENVQTRDFEFTRTMSTDSFIQLHATYSRVITASPQEREAELARAAAALAERFPGQTELEVPMRSHCWRADRAPRRTGPS